MKRFISLVILFGVCLSLLVGCSQKKWACDTCHTIFTGTAYHGQSLDSTLCKDCAWKYWQPFPLENYRKEQLFQ